MSDEVIDQSISPSGGVEGSFNVTTPYFSDYQLLAMRETHVLYKARRYGRYYVLKGLQPSHRNPAQIEWLYKEYCIGVSLNHPNVVRVESIEDDPVVGRCIVMEWVEGVSLDVWVRQHRGVAERREVLRQLLSAVAHCHSRQVCHRDLKPSNVLVTDEGNVVKLLDFGLADGPQYAAFKQASGTVGWTAPEQSEGLPVHAETDIYAVGLIIRKLMPHQFRRAARHALRRNPQRRPQSAEAMARLLQSRLPQHLALAFLLAVAAAAGVLSYYRVDDSEYSALLPSGQEVHYKVLSHWHREVALVRPAAWDSDRRDTLSLPSGNMVIPATLRHRHHDYRIATIASKAFAGCDGLTALRLPEGLLRIDDEAFRNCTSLADTLTVPATLQWIGADAFRHCANLTFVVWRATECSSNDRENEFYFSECTRLQGVIVADGVRRLPAGLFGFMEALRSASLPASLVHLPDYLFMNSHKLEAIVLSDSLQTIGEKAFMCTHLSAIDLPSTVRRIGSSAFFLTWLQRVSIGESIAKIGAKAFYMCNFLKQMDILAERPPLVEKDAMLTHTSVTTFPNRSVLRVPAGAKAQYRQEPEFRTNFSSITALPQQ